MPISNLRSVNEFITELNENPDASFQELANHFDIWASQERCTRKQMIEFVSRKTDRISEEAMEARPIANGEFIEFPVVIFSIQGSA